MIIILIFKGKIILCLPLFKEVNMKKFRGAYTVEAAFIIPLMIISIFAIIYLSVAHYQSIVSVAEATRSANRVASYWSYIGFANPPALRDSDDVKASEIITASMYDKRSPYRFITELISESAGQKGNGMRINNGKKYTNSRISGIKFDTYSDPSYKDKAEIKTEMGFLSSYVTVTVQKRYINPLGRMMEIIGVGETKSFESKSNALITNPSEFIRNIDTITQVGYYLKTYIGK